MINDIPPPGAPNFELRVREAIHTLIGRTGNRDDHAVLVGALRRLTVGSDDGQLEEVLTRLNRLEQKANASAYDAIGSSLNRDEPVTIEDVKRDLDALGAAFQALVEGGGGTDNPTGGVERLTSGPLTITNGQLILKDPDGEDNLVELGTPEAVFSLGDGYNAPLHWDGQVLVLRNVSIESVNAGLGPWVNTPLLVHGAVTQSSYSSGTGAAVVVVDVESDTAAPPLAFVQCGASPLPYDALLVVSSAREVPPATPEDPPTVVWDELTRRVWTVRAGEPFTTQFVSEPFDGQVRFEVTATSPLPVLCQVAVLEMLR